MKQLDNLVRIGKLKAESPSRVEFEGLVRSGRARLRDAQTAGLSVYGQFDLAYNAAHALALAALRRSGYRSESRYLVFQCLEHTVDLPAASWRVLDRAHNKRNIAEYSGDTEVEVELLAALLRVAQDLERRVNELPVPT